jgi:hypothetical protein
MPDSSEIVVDLEATVAYIHDRVTEQAESFDFDQNVELRDRLNNVISEARTAGSLLEQTMLSQLEGGVRQVGSRLFKRKRSTNKRFRHDSIRGVIGHWARAKATDENGVTSPSLAVDNAMQALADLYVSPSTPAKVTRFEAYGIDAKAVTDYEDKGWRLEVEELDDRKD